MNKWYSGDGKDSDIVMSSRVTVARNLSDAPFANRMTGDIRKNVCKKIFAAIKNSPYAGEFDLIDLSNCSQEQAQSYVEKQLISSEFARNKDKSSFLLSKECNVSIMLCEQDHIDINSMTAGLDLESAYNAADKLDDIFIGRLHIAYDDALGFLTAMPTILGTGMTASVDLHLPAISQKNMINRLSAMVGKLGMTLRPIYSDASAFYRLSNHITLGISEKSAIDNLNAICSQIIKQERTIRDYLAQNDDFEDKIYRALGTLTMARRLSYTELCNLASLVRLGISMGYIDKPYAAIGDLMQLCGANTIIVASNAEITNQQADKIRADLAREKLK